MQKRFSEEQIVGTLRQADRTSSFRCRREWTATLALPTLSAGPPLVFNLSFFNLPNYLAASPNALLLPREVAVKDGLNIQK